MGISFIFSMGYSCSGNFTAWEGEVDTSLLSAAPDVNLNDSIKDLVLASYMFIAPLALLVLGIIVILLFKCFSCLMCCFGCCRTGKIGGCKNVLFQIFFYLFALATVAIGIVAIVAGVHSDLEPGMCNAGAFFSYSSNAYDNLSVALSSPPVLFSETPVVGNKGAQAYGISVCTDALQDSLTQAAKIDTTFTSLSDTFNANLYKKLGADSPMDLFARAALAITVPKYGTILSDEIVTSQSNFADIVLSLTRASDSVMDDTVAAVTNAEYGVVVALSVVGTVIAFLGVLCGLLFMTVKGGPGKMGGQSRCCRLLVCVSKWNHLLSFIIILLIAIPLALYAYTFGGFCKQIVKDPFPEAASYFEDLQNPKLKTCFGPERTGSMFVTGTYFSEFANGLETYSALGAVNPFSGTNAVITSTQASFAALTSTSGLTEFYCYTCPASLFTIPGVFSPAVCTRSLCDFTTWKASMNTVIGQIQTEYTSGSFESTAFVNLQTDYAIPNINSYLTTLSRDILSKDDCTSFNDDFESVAYEICIGSMPNSLTAANMWIVLGVFFWVLYFFYRKMRKYMAIEVLVVFKDSQGTTSAQVVPLE
eukprot:GDKK01048067.1.p1 GENE.GDKK01048067.1~~GDKK01048067.1.p1  ORF type:complete len:591 (+),score=129.33 GDKK01048067.1:1-1773(+)